jgi:hypothetical protein
MEAVNAWLSHSDPATPHIAAHSRRQPPPFVSPEQPVLPAVQRPNQRVWQHRPQVGALLVTRYNGISESR